MSKNTSRNISSLLLRVGLGIVFLYAAISSFKTPNDWIGYLPQILRNHFDAVKLLKVFSAYELVLALWLASGKLVKIAALLAAATLAGIVAANYHLFAITFRDIALIFAALALVFLDK